MRNPATIATISCALLVAIGMTAARALPPGDAKRGEGIYDRCGACHSIDRDRTGPRHAGLFGRRAGSVPGFPYSPAMKKAGAAGLVWTEETLDKFLKAPTKFVVGTRMGYAGIKDDQERADLIAFLKTATSEAAAATK
jgi:cytochrome c